MRESFDRLRELIYEPPTERGWVAICELFEAWGEGIEVGLEYAGDHLERWPVALRCAEIQVPYMQREFYSIPPYTPLVRVLKVSGRSFKHLTTTLQSIPFDRLEALHLHGYHEKATDGGLTGEHIKALSCPALRPDPTSPASGLAPFGSDRRRSGRDQRGLAHV